MKVRFGTQEKITLMFSIIQILSYPLEEIVKFNVFRVTKQKYFLFVATSIYEKVKKITLKHIHTLCPVSPTMAVWIFSLHFCVPLSVQRYSRPNGRPVAG